MVFLKYFFNVHFLYYTHLSLRISPKLIVQRRKGVGIKQILGGTKKRSLFSFDSWGCIIVSPRWNKPFPLVLSSCRLLSQWHHALHRHTQTLSGHPQFSILSFISKFGSHLLILFLVSRICSLHFLLCSNLDFLNQGLMISKLAAKILPYSRFHCAISYSLSSSFPY